MVAVLDLFMNACTWPWGFTGNTKGFSLPVSVCLPPSNTHTLSTHTHTHALCMVITRDWMQWAGDSCWMLMRFFGCFLEKRGEKRRSGRKLLLCLQDREEGRRKGERERGRERERTALLTSFISVKSCPRLLVRPYVCVCVCNHLSTHTYRWKYFYMTHARESLWCTAALSYHIIHCHYARWELWCTNTPVNMASLSTALSHALLLRMYTHKPALSSLCPSFYVRPD